jgi:hypothetical protein
MSDVPRRRAMRSKDWQQRQTGRAVQVLYWEAVSIGERRQMRLNGAYLFQELQWIQCAGHFPQSDFGGLWETLSLQQPITGGLWRMVAFGYLGPLAMLLRELKRGLEEVHEQPRSAVQSGDRLCGGDALETAVAQKFAHNSAVLLLDPGLVVLTPRSRARELDPMAEAILDQ